jgi:hypothetical protein
MTAPRVLFQAVLSLVVLAALLLAAQLFASKPASKLLAALAAMHCAFMKSKVLATQSLCYGSTLPQPQDH